MKRVVQGQINMLEWVMVDATDFATPESALSAAMSIKIYGTLVGNSNVFFVTSGTGSLAASNRDVVHVGASATGVYAVPLGSGQLSDASNAFYDTYIAIITGTGAAQQVIMLSGVRATASDILSTMGSQFAVVSNYLSNASNYLSNLSDLASNAYSAAAQANSRILLIQSRLSDLDSRLTSDVSDILSGITALSALVSDVDSALTSRFSNLESLLTVTGVQLNASTMSDLRSAINGVTATVSASDISDIASAVRAILVSDLSDILSAAQQTNSRVLLNQSRISDIASFLVDLSGAVSDTYSQLSDFRSDLNSLLTTTGVQLNASTMSDLRSAIAAGPAATVTASDISDIASAVRAAIVSDLSDILSAAQQTNSRVLVVQSLVSDVDSALTSRFSDLLSLVTTTGVQLNASTMSDLRSAINAGPAATVTASDISDIASAVRAILVSDLSDILSAAQQTNSRVLVVQSLVSDVDSALTSRFSNLESLLTTTGVQLNASTMSDLRSAINGVTATVSASDISDIASAVRATLVSDLSDILSAAQQTNSRVLVVQSLVSDVDSALTSRFSDLLSLVTVTGVQLNASTMSDLRSAINGVTATVSASDISDIASAVRATLVSDLSDILSAAQQTNSRALVIQSLVSDVDSALTSRFSNLESLLGTTGVQLHASTMSDLRSAIAGVTATLGASDISDIASAVRAILVSDLSDILSAAQQANSRALVVQSAASDIYSLLSGSRGEPGQGAPPATTTALTKLDYLYKAWRNRHTVGGGTYRLYADDATTVDQAAAVSDDGTTTEVGEMGTGA